MSGIKQEMLDGENPLEIVSTYVAAAEKPQEPLKHKLQTGRFYSM